MCSYALSSKLSYFKDEVVRNAGSNIAVDLSYNENCNYRVLVVTADFWGLLFQEVDAESCTHAALLFLTLCLQLTPVDLVIKPYRVTHNHHFIKQICIIKGIS